MNATRQADRVGAHGRAWRIPMAPPDQRGRPEFAATVDGWLLYRPGAHPLWECWMVAVIHLRLIDGALPAHIKKAGATHELMIAALNPDRELPDLEAVGRGEASFAFLTPIDVAEQFAVLDDAQAAQLCEMAIRVCVDGLASPDQDWRGWWRDAVAETAEHLRSGLHPEGRA